MQWTNSDVLFHTTPEPLIDITLRQDWSATLFLYKTNFIILYCIHKNTFLFSYGITVGQQMYGISGPLKSE